MSPMEPHGEDEQPPPREPWGRLLRLGAEEDEPQILLWKREWTIGRRRGCDLSFPSNKLVSGDHCKLRVDEKSGEVTLEDTSTNGTVINKLRVVKKQTYPLQSGDIIYLVYRKNEPEHKANKENMFHVTKESSGPGQGDDPQVPLLSPMAQTCLEEPQPSTSTSDLLPTASTSSTEPELTSAGQKHSSSSGPGTISISPKECSSLVANGELSSLSSVFQDNEASFSLLKTEDTEELEPVSSVKTFCMTV